MVLYSWWPFTQQSEFLLVEDNHFTTNRTNNPPVLQVAHDPDRRLGSGSHHISNFLSGEGEGKAKLRRKHKQYTGQALLNSLSGKVSEAALGIPELSSQDINNLQCYLRMIGQKR